MNHRDFISEKGILKKYTGKETEISIPDEFKKLGGYSFANHAQISRITLSERLTEIGAFAFRGCEGLKEIFIPRNVAKIENGAFADCRALQAVTVAKDHPVYYVKQNCLMEIATKKLIFGCRNSVIPEEASEIAPYAFAGCKGLTRAVIPEGVSAIGECAFARCSGLLSAALPETVRSIGRSAFEGCLRLDGIQLPSGIKKIEESTFSLCAKLSRLHIPEGVEKIGYAAFAFCKSLKEVHIPESVCEIGELSFSHCRSLSYLILPKRISYIGQLGDGLPLIGVSLVLPALREPVRLQAAVGYAIAVSRKLASYSDGFRKLHVFEIQQSKDKLLALNEANGEILSVLQKEKPVTVEELHAFLFPEEPSIDGIV